jgi:hypothetical protein
MGGMGAVTTSSAAEAYAGGKVNGHNTRKPTDAPKLKRPSSGVVVLGERGFFVSSVRDGREI